MTSEEKAKELLSELSRLKNKQGWIELYGNTNCYGNNRRVSEVIGDAIECISALHSVEAERPKPVGHFYNRPREGRVGVEWCCDHLDDGAALYAEPVGVEAEKEPEWISVEDRFPEEGEWVIAATYLLEPISGRKTPIAKELFFDGVTESGVACWLADGDWPNPVSDWRKFPALPEHNPE